MKRFIAVVAMIAALTPITASVAQAMPTYGSRNTARHGYIVWAENDRNYWIRTTCRWYAGSSWVWRVKLPPHYWKWTTSDAGRWGNYRPQNLTCSYRRLY